MSAFTEKNEFKEGLRRAGNQTSHGNLKGDQRKNRLPQPKPRQESYKAGVKMRNIRERIKPATNEGLLVAGYKCYFFGGILGRTSIFEGKVLGCMLNRSMTICPKSSG